MSKNVELQEALIDSREPFGLTNSDIIPIFETKHYLEGQSTKMLKAMGGSQGFLQSLKSNVKTGISTTNQQELTQRRNKYGTNKPVTKDQVTIWQLIVDQLEDQILQILIAAAIVSLIIGISTEGWEKGWLEGVAITVAIFIILTVTATNDYMKEKQFRKLNAQLNDRNINVKRDGQIKNINIDDLLVGDILIIEQGEVLPVDGILVEGKVVCDESNLTGESDDRKKDSDTNNSKADNILLSGAKVNDGSGICLVATVGISTALGQMKLKLQEKSEKTPLQEKLDILTEDITTVGQLCAGLTFSLMSLHLIYNRYAQDLPFFDVEVLNEILHFFILAVTILVVAIPEGLPLSVTIALAYSVGKMKDENNLVRYLAACETMGGAQHVCTDKTGTLTTNRMTVTDVFTQDATYNELNKSIFNEKLLKLLCEGACVNASAYPKLKDGRKIEEHIGNKTECALLDMALKMGFNFTKYRPDTDKILKVWPFNSTKKRMSTIFKQTDKIYRVFVKGGMDFLFDDCSNYIGQDGETIQIDEEYKERLQQTMKSYAKQSLRTLLLAYRDIEKQDLENIDEDDVVQSLTIIALVGIKDPLRKGIQEAVQKCNRASVKVRMVTGDIKDTAIAIAKQAGILDKHYDPEDQFQQYVVMTGREFRDEVGGLKQFEITEFTKNDETQEDMETQKLQRFRYEVGDLQKFEQVMAQLSVLARATPDDKFLMATGLKQLGQVVAMTGDGANDAPALKKADVGFAMGIAGCEVAKEASGIILLDDNFGSIVTAMKWGRNIFECIRKFLQFQVTVNVVAMFMVFLGGVILTESPLNSIQMLWVNLIMDTFAAIALATEPPHDELLKRKPYLRKEYMITPMMWRNIAMHSIYQMAVLLVILFKGPEIFNVPNGVGNEHWTFENGQHFTIFFHVFVFLQLFNEINCRKLKKSEINVFAGFFNNGLFLFVIILTIVVQVSIVELGGLAVHVSPLTPEQHIQCLGIGATSLIIGFLIKIIPEGFYNHFTLFHVEQEETRTSVGTKRSIIRRSSRYKRQQSVNVNK